MIEAKTKYLKKAEFLKMCVEESEIMPQFVIDTD